jgi:ABC-type phosphate transport system ATPase subunit
MRRATTPTHTFTFPEDVEVDSVTGLLVTYSQCGKTLLEKTLNDVVRDVENNNFSLALTQSEVNLFAPGKALVQLRAKVGGAVLASQMIWLEIKPVLNSEIL